MNKIKMFSATDYIDHRAYTLLENRINDFGENNKIINISICWHNYHENERTKFRYTAAVIYKDDPENIHITD